MSKHPFTGQRPARWTRTAALLAAPVILALFIALFAGPRAGQAQGETLVRCNPAAAAGVVGQPLDVDIYVENVKDLWAGDVQFSFDTTIAQVMDANPDPNVPGVQLTPLNTFLLPDFVVRNQADNAAGTIWYAASQVQNPVGQPPKPTANGSGPLARITFQAVKAGSFTMPITYQKIVLPSGDQIDATPVDCQISFIVVDTDLSIYLPVAMDMN
jgi:hypothetical protein